ncbi:serine hydrolase domain-containing protein [Pandoraea bronchicola]|uniref:Serine hydrolase n=1 Tax=Pandoraea bronchicola TaxID=2508287 RepID=A0A5E5BKS9_9BURK|nr:serine hydrolase domain-containing protein [Pandoraea bronchicola]VVE86861.1 serine hydrolase [Pandoraea bronchicola]
MKAIPTADLLSADQHAALTALFAPYARTDAPGVVIGIARHGEVCYRRAFGMASLEHGRALTAATRLRIGSTSKHFTCLAALLLCEDGRLDADMSVGAYLPELPPSAGAPTLRQLMTHRGGQRCSLDLALLTQGLAVSLAGASLAAQQRQRDENFPPGERMIYSNGGYHLLSLAIERACGMPFGAFLKARIFTPMGMRDTDCVANDMAIVPGMATQHVPDGQGGFQRGVFPSWDVLGEGSIVSTVDDMLRWTAHLRGAKRIGNARTWAQMLDMPVFSSGQRSQYALGLKRNDYRGVELTHHAGGVIGGTSQMVFSAAYGIDIVLLSNGAVGAPVELAKRVIDIVLADVLSGTGAPVPLLAAGHAARLGGYRSPQTNAVYALEDRNGALALTAFHCTMLPMPLFATGDGAEIETGSEGALAVLWGTPDAPQDPSTLRIAHCGHVDTFRRLNEPPELTPEAIASIGGCFESHDANARATIDADDTGLVLHMHGPGGACDYRLAALENDVFGFTPARLTDIMTGILTLVRDAPGGIVTGFHIDTQRSRHLAFTRVCAGACRYPNPLI